MNLIPKYNTLQEAMTKPVYFWSQYCLELNQGSRLNKAAPHLASVCKHPHHAPVKRHMVLKSSLPNISQAITYTFYVKYKIGWQIEPCKIFVHQTLQESMNLQFRHFLAPLLNPLYFSKDINTNNYTFNGNYILNSRLYSSFSPSI